MFARNANSHGRKKMDKSKLAKELTVKDIESEIMYEEHKGIHTYHECDCGRGACRSSMCAKCWREVLDKKIKKVLDKR